MLSVKRHGVGRRVVAVSHFITWQLGKRFPKTIPLVFVVGYPKSGTTWACQLAAAYLRMPFPRRSLIPIGFPAVVHGHELVEKEYPYCIYVIRDGRDVMTSLFYHIRRLLLDGERRFLPKDEHSIYLDAEDQETVRKNFPRFLESQIETTVGCKTSWSRHVESYLQCERSQVACLKYEELLTGDAEALSRELAKLDGKDPSTDRAKFILEDYSFANTSGRKPNTEDKSSFMRKGIAGDWRNHFNRESAQIFDHHCGKALLEVGYEQDRSWIENLPSS